MKSNCFLATIACVALISGVNTSKAQDAILLEESVTVTDNVKCKTLYSPPSSWRENWFVQLGAGAQSPYVENYSNTGSNHRHITSVYNLGVGRWFTPYIGVKMSAYYGAIHWNQGVMNKAKLANLNVDLMWDMFNSLAGYNPSRFFSIVPYVGVGGSFVHDFKSPNANDFNRKGEVKRNQWLLPLSLGLQMRFRLCDYADFFTESRVQFYGDNFNNYAGGYPIDVNLTAIGGFTLYLGERSFNSFNPCDYQAYINEMNGKVNTLRQKLQATNTALDIAKTRLQNQDPEVVEGETVIIDMTSPILTAVRFNINSAEITDEEMVNVYNVAQWLKANPQINVAVDGYADADTGTAEYNQTLSEQRVKAVIDHLINDYGISASRLKAHPCGSAEQPYEQNNWNRIVIFTQP